MVVVNDGLRQVRKWLAQSGGQPPTSIALGTDGTAPTENDVALGNEISSTEKTWDVRTEGDFTIDYEYELGAGEGNGLTFQEFGLMESVTDSLYSRDTFTSVNKSSANEIQINLTIKLENEV